MLLSVKNAAIAALTALAIAATPAAPALAWGQREQDFTKGVVATMALGALLRQNNAKPAPAAPVYVQPRTVYVEPQPRVVYVEPQSYVPANIYRTPVARAFQSYSTAERRMIQKRLAAYGYYRGGIDGSFGPSTYSAISVYADDEGQADLLASMNGSFGVLDGLIY